MIVNVPVSNGLPLSVIVAVPVASKAQPAVELGVTRSWHALVVLLRMSMRKMYGEP